MKGYHVVKTREKGTVDEIVNWLELAHFASNEKNVKKLIEAALSTIETQVLK